MALQDYRHLDPKVSIDADVCIVGSGPAGWTLADELADSGLRILVLESGGVAESGGCGGEPEMAVLNTTEDVGVPLFNGRCRTLGGTPEMVPWGNRCIAFDDIDYETRPWVPFSGWPFGSETLAPYLDRASRLLGAGAYYPDGPPLPPTLAAGTKPDVDRERLRNVWWSFGRGEHGDTIRYAKLFRQRPKDKVRVIVHATVTHLNTNGAGNQIESVEVSYPDGHRTTVNARAVVLCAGGIENARILLYSNRAMPNGIGNANGLVGRFLMDHPRDLKMTVTFDGKEANKLHALFGPFLFDGGDGRRDFVAGLALSPEIQRREGLLNCAAWPVMDHVPDDPILAAQRLKRLDHSNAAKDLRLIASHPGLVLRGVHSWAVRKQPARTKYSKIGFYISSEQRPDPDSRVTLSGNLDALGLPIARTDWRINEQERQSQAVFAKTIKKEFDRLRLPEAHLADWVRDGRHEQAVLSDGCHPTGTTRMTSDPRAGVVNADCQVHGIDGLFIVGSSVFPTAGHANPTLMIVALASRLAQHLRRRLSNEAGPKLDIEAVTPTQIDIQSSQTVPSRDLPAFATRLEESLS